MEAITGSFLSPISRPRGHWLFGKAYGAAERETENWELATRSISHPGKAGKQVGITVPWIGTDRREGKNLPDVLLQCRQPPVQIAERPIQHLSITGVLAGVELSHYLGPG